MSKPEHITFDEFAANISAAFERVVHEQEIVVVERNGVAAAPRQAKSKADREAFLSTFGAWEDVDTEEFIKENYEQRNRSIRPPVEL